MLLETLFMRTIRPLFCAFTLLFSLCLLTTVGLCSEVDNRPRLSVGYTTKSLGDIDIKDIKAALTSWIQELGEREGFRTENHIYDDIQSLFKDYQKGMLDLVVLQSLDYFRNVDKTGRELAITKVKQGKLHTRYVFVTDNNVPSNSMGYLKNKKLSITRQSDLGMAFMDTILLKAKLPEAHRFFSDIQKKNNESQALLAVFFGQADACITTEMAFKTMAELNPQVGEKLRIAAISPELIETVSFFSDNVDSRYREKLANATMKLHTYPRGKQVLLLFNADKNVRLTKENLVSTKAFVEEYYALKGIK